jgi:hypothetical protein
MELLEALEASTPTLLVFYEREVQRLHQRLKSDDINACTLCTLAPSPFSHCPVPFTYGVSLAL